MKANQSYRIVSLTASNVKRLKAVTIKPDGNMVEISGRNGAGKTSVLDAIWWALAGTKNVQGKPIRDGQEQAKIELSLGPVIVTRTFKIKESGGYTTALTVEGEDGMKYSSPQAILDAIVGDLTFDPLAFTREKPKDQFITLQQFVDGYDFDEAAMRRKNYFDERTSVNREAKALKAKIDGIPDLPEGQEVFDLSDATTAYQKGVSEQRDIDEMTRRISSAASEVDARIGRIEAIKSEISSLTDEMEKIKGEIVGLQRIAKRPIPEPVDLTALEQRMNTAQSQTNLIAQQKRKDEYKNEHLEAESKSAELTAKIESIDEERQKAVSESKIPVKGITFGFNEKDEGIVLLDGVPFEQGSDAQRLRAAIEIAIAMNPQLRVCRVRDGSLIDDDGMKALAEYAEKHDFQIWIERVDASGKSGIVIENGEILGSDS